MRGWIDCRLGGFLSYKLLFIAVLIWVLTFNAASSCLAGANGEMTDQIAIDFAHRFQNEIQTGNVQAAISEFDAFAILKSAEAGITAPSGFQNGFNSTGAPAFTQSLADTLSQTVAKGGQFVFRFFTTRNQQPVVAFRIESANGAINFEDFYLRQDPGGLVKVTDVYIASTGERVSETVRRLYLAAVIAQDKTLAGQLGQRERDFVDHFDQFTAMGQDIKKADFQGALNAYASMPADVQHEKFVMFMRLSAADQLISTSPEQFKEALKDCTKYYPNDPALDLFTLDRFVTDKDFAGAVADVDRLIDEVGDDANLETLRGGMLVSEGHAADFPAAIKAYQQAIHLEPHRKKAYWGLVSVYLKQKDFKQTAGTLTQIQKTLHLRINDLTRIPLYADFVKSPEYRQWLAQQPHAPASTQPFK